MNNFTSLIFQATLDINCPDLILYTEESGDDILYLTIKQGQLSNIGALWAQLVEVLIDNKIVNSAIEVYQIETGKFWLINFNNHWLCFSEDSYAPPKLPTVPLDKKPLILAIGGCSGSSKTTIGRRISRRLNNQVIMYPAYTTRSPRKGETDGVDYHFIDKCNLQEYQCNPYYSEFIKARNSWYWVNRYQVLNSVIGNLDKIHIFFITQRHEFKIKSKFFPWMDWVWLKSPREQIKNRLKERGDKNIDKSLIHNSKILSIDISDLIALQIDNLDNQFDETVEKIITFIHERRE